MIPLKVGSFVTEPQGPTYSPEVGETESLTTTQPDLDRSLTSSEEVVLIPSKETEVVIQVVPVTIPRVQPEQEYVVRKILETFPDAPIMVYVAMCESGLDPLADRITYDGRTGIDVGLFQINQVHLNRLNQLGLDRYDLYDNLTYARMLYDESGLRPWHMSKHCWSKFL